MIVGDASVVIDLVLGWPLPPGAAELARRLTAGADVAAPFLIDAEVGHVLRRFERRGDLDPLRARTALLDYEALPIRRYAHTPILQRAFDLRADVTFYDALYLALAERLDVPLLTADARLAGVPGCAATVEVRG